MIEIKIDKKYITMTKYVIIVVFIFIVVAMFFSGMGYKKPVKKSIGLINKRVEDSLTYRKYSTLDAQYDFSELYANIMDDKDDTYARYIESLEEKYGDDFKVSYKIAEADKLDEKSLKELETEIISICNSQRDSSEETLATYEAIWNSAELTSKEHKKLKKSFGKYIEECSDVDVTSAYKVGLDCKIKGSEGKDEFDVQGLIVAKVNGKWIIVEGAINPYVALVGTMK